jgi:hypothetical protein
MKTEDTKWYKEEVDRARGMTNRILFDEFELAAMDIGLGNEDGMHCGRSDTILEIRRDELLKRLSQYNFFDGADE